MSDELKRICDELAESGLDLPSDMSSLLSDLSDASKMDALIAAANEQGPGKAQGINALARSLLGDYARHVKLLEAYKTQIEKLAFEAGKLASRHPVNRGGLPAPELKK